MNKYSEEEKNTFIQNHKEFEGYLKNKELIDSISVSPTSFSDFENLPENERNSIKNQLKSNKVYHWIAK